jgi:hypothetical protein
MCLICKQPHNMRPVAYFAILLLCFVRLRVLPSDQQYNHRSVDIRNFIRTFDRGDNSPLAFNGALASCSHRTDRYE